jgi:hypothetical protein
MKKITLLFTVSVASIMCFSQTEKGSWLLGGNIEFTFSKQEIYNNVTKSTQFEFNPNVGYFIAPNFAIGLEIGLSSISEESNGSDEDVSLFSAGPFARYYFNASKNVKILTGAAMGFGKTKGILDYSKHSVTAWQIEAGPAFFLRPTVALEFLVHYQAVKFKGQDAFYNATNKNFGVGLGLQFYLTPKTN